MPECVEVAKKSTSVAEFGVAFDLAEEQIRMLVRQDEDIIELAGYIGRLREPYHVFDLSSYGEASGFISLTDDARSGEAGASEAEPDDGEPGDDDSGDADTGDRP